MTLQISKNRTIHDIQQDFNSQFPFLKLEFYRTPNVTFLPLKKHLLHSALLGIAGLQKNGELEIWDEMTVAELEKSFLTRFGMNAQVSRKSGILWLETTMTDKWTLQKQNDHGREISVPAEKEVVERDDQNK